MISEQQRELASRAVVQCLRSAIINGTVKTESEALKLAGERRKQAYRLLQVNQAPTNRARNPQ